MFSDTFTGVTRHETVPSAEWACFMFRTKWSHKTQHRWALQRHLIFLICLIWDQFFIVACPETFFIDVDFSQPPSYFHFQDPLWGWDPQFEKQCCLISFLQWEMLGAHSPPHEYSHSSLLIVPPGAWNLPCSRLKKNKVRRIQRCYHCLRRPLLSQHLVESSHFLMIDSVHENAIVGDLPSLNMQQITML